MALFTSSWRVLLAQVPRLEAQHAMAEDDEADLVEAVVRVRLASSDRLAASQIHDVLANEGSSASLAQVKKACSKASKRVKPVELEPMPAPVLSKKQREAVKWVTDSKPDSVKDTLSILADLAFHGETRLLEAAVNAGWLSGRNPAERADILHEATYQGRPLLYALQAGHLSTVTYLLSRPDDFPVDEMTGFVWRVAGSPDLKTKASPLLFVIGDGGVCDRKWQLAELLVDAGASPVAERSHDGWTPLRAMAKSFAQAGTIIDTAHIRTVQRSAEYNDARACLEGMLKRVVDPATLGCALRDVLSPTYALAMDAAVMLIEAGADPAQVLPASNTLALGRLEGFKSETSLSLAQYLMGEQFWVTESDKESKKVFEEDMQRQLTEFLNLEVQQFQWGHVRFRRVPDTWREDEDAMIKHAPDELLALESIFLFVDMSKECKHDKDSYDKDSMWLLNPAHGLAIEAHDQAIMGPFSFKTGPVRFQQSRPGLWFIVRIEKLPLDQCAWCESTSAELMTCGKCHQARYCSSECQASHWKLHKTSCRLLGGA